MKLLLFHFQACSLTFLYCMLAIFLPPYGPNQCPKTECLSLNVQLPIVTTGGHWFYIQQPLYTAHMDKQPFYLFSHEGYLGCTTRHRLCLHCSQLCSLLFIVYFKLLLCSRPALLCRDNHSRVEAVNDDCKNALVTFIPDRITRSKSPKSQQEQGAYFNIVR